MVFAMPIPVIGFASIQVIIYLCVQSLSKQVEEEVLMPTMKAIQVSAPGGDFEFTGRRL
jgi:hypothetical protein